MESFLFQNPRLFPDIQVFPNLWPSCQYEVTMKDSKDDLQQKYFPAPVTSPRGHFLGRAKLRKSNYPRQRNHSPNRDSSK